MSAIPRSKYVQSAHESDDALLTLLAGGALAPLGTLYDRYHRDVRRVLARVATNPADIDDLIQATFLELPKVAAAFDWRASARAWIIGIAVRLASRRRRGFARLMRALGALVHVAESQTTLTPETLAGEREELRAFDIALAALSADKRNVFVLVEIEGVPPADVAESLGIPPATVRTRLFHARAELRAAMNGVGMKRGVMKGALS